MVGLELGSRLGRADSDATTGVDVESLVRGPNSACDVGLPLELTSGLGRDRGESGGLGGVLVAPARRREKLGRLFIGIVGSGCTRSRIMRLGLVRVRTVDIKGTGGITG